MNLNIAFLIFIFKLPAANFLFTSQTRSSCLFPVGMVFKYLHTVFEQGIFSIAERPCVVMPVQCDSCSGRPHFLQADKASARTPSSTILRPHLQSVSSLGHSLVYFK